MPTALRHLGRPCSRSKPCVRRPRSWEPCTPARYLPGAGAPAAPSRCQTPRSPDDPRTRPLNANPTPTVAPEAASPVDPLDAFIGAAEVGPLLWARRVDGHLVVCAGTSPTQPITNEVGRLFVAALRAHFGSAASGVAEREWGLNEQSRRLLPARTVRHAVACAESALSLLQAQAHLLQIEFSAVLSGWRFRRVAQTLGLDPASLSPERRQALDQLLAPHCCDPLPASADALAERLRALLTTDWH